MLVRLLIYICVVGLVYTNSSYWMISLTAKVTNDEILGS